MHNVPQLRRLREMFPDELVVIGVHSAKFPSEQLTQNIRQAVMREGIEHPVVNDAGFKTWNAYAVRAWPTLVLIDPHGRIAGEVSGEIQADEFAANIREVIEQNQAALVRGPLVRRLEAQLEPERPLRYPARLLISGESLFIADTGHHRVIEVRLDADAQAGEVLRVFGSGTPGLQDGSMGEARFNHPHGMGLRGDAHSGTLFVADTENHAIRAVDLATGAVRTVAGTGQKAHGRLALTAPTETPLRSPWAVLPLEADYLLIAMAGSHQIWALINEQQIGPFAGNGVEDLVDGPVAEASFNQPSDLAFDPALGGYLFVADPEASAVRAISLIQSPQVMTLVGQGLFEFGDQDGPTQTALLQHSLGLTVGEQQLYIADSYNHKIKQLDPAAGQVNTLIGTGRSGYQDGSFESAQFFEPEGVQFQSGRLYIADTNNHCIRVADLDQRRVSTLRLRGLERLAGEKTNQSGVERLTPVQAGRGTLRLVLDVALPPGYKRNAEAPSILQVGDTERAARYTFNADQPIAWTVDLDEDQDLPLELTLYYCQADAAQLCLIEDRRLVLPLRVSGDGPAEVRLPFKVEDRKG